MEEIIPVVAACILSTDERVLLQKKFEAQDERGIARNPELLGKWELPGGMMKYGETPEQALQREVWEEEGMRVGVYDIVDIKTHIFADKKHYLLLYYVCVPTKGQPTRGRWFSKGELKGLDCLPDTDKIATRALDVYFG